MAAQDPGRKTQEHKSQRRNTRYERRTTIHEPCGTSGDAVATELTKIKKAVVRPPECFCRWPALADCGLLAYIRKTYLC